MSNEKKAATLGMSPATASHRLRKILLFELLKKHSENICFRCKELIVLIDELSVEHIEPWEGRSAELFWDLKNIAFSHIKCNRPQTSPAYNKDAPEGTSWCSGHRDYLLRECFNSNKSNAHGLGNYCRQCCKERR